MKPIVSGLGLLIVCSVTTLSAQRTPTAAQQPAHNVYVLTGCVDPAEPYEFVYHLRSFQIGATVPNPDDDNDSGGEGSSGSAGGAGSLGNMFGS